MCVGGKGVVSVASNIVPKQMLKLVELFDSGNIIEAINLNKSLYPLFKALFIDTNPIPLKFFSYKLGLSSEDSVRLPLVKSSNSEVIENLNKIYNSYLLNENNISNLSP